MATSAPSAPTVTAVRQGDAVTVSYYGPSHEIVNAIGFVTSVDSISPDLQGPRGEPAVSVVIADRLNLSALGTPRFWNGFRLLTGVVVQGHPALASRKAVAAYEWAGDIQSHLPNLLESIDAPPANPIFERIQLPAKPDTAVPHAAAVQAGQIEGPTVVSPSVSETLGTTGAPTSTSTEPQHTGETPKE